MSRFKTRANEVSAVEVKIENSDELKALMGDNGDLRPYLEHEFAAVLVTARGVAVALPGDYVFEDTDGLHKSSPEAFNAMFEPVEAE